MLSFAALIDPLIFTMSGIIELENEANEFGAFLTFLKKVSLEEKLGNFQSNGLKRIEHLQDIQEKDIGVLGLTVFEWRRLQREITTWNTKEKEKSASTQRNGAAFRTSSASTVVSLPKSFKNFFQTRDGQGNVVVSIEALKKKFKNLWYEKPINPTQMFSNSFILQMAEQRMQFEKTHRGCELRCRNQRSKRIYFLLAAAKQPAINTWNHYYKNQSMMGKCEIVDDQFRAVASFLEASEDSSDVPPKPMYEMVCQYVGKLEEESTFSTTVLQKCDAEVAEYMADNGPKRGKL